MENRFDFETEVHNGAVPSQHELAFNLGGSEIGKLACLLAWIPRGSVDVVSSFHRKPLPE